MFLQSSENAWQVQERPSMHEDKLFEDRICDVLWENSPHVAQGDFSEIKK